MRLHSSRSCLPSSPTPQCRLLTVSFATGGGDFVATRQPWLLPWSSSVAPATCAARHSSLKLCRPTPSLRCTVLTSAAGQADLRGVARTADLPTSANCNCTLSVSQGDRQQDDEFVPIPVDMWHRDPVLMSGCELDGPPLNVAVLLSGGVDSSLALQLLVAAGHKCKAFYLQIWFQEDFRNFWDACPWEEDLKYAQKVCDALGVELEVVPLTQAYWDSVVSHSVAQIRAGRTPNPDMLCNSRVKFGAFLDLLEARGAMAGDWREREATQQGAQVTRDTCGSSGAGGGRASEVGVQRFDRVASGHYARVLRGGGLQARGQHEREQLQELALLLQQRQHSGADASTSASSSSGSSGGCGSCGSARLALSADPVKDQSYFLAQLSPRQLSQVMFPLGGLTKPQVRQLAVSAGLATQARKDSQGICFLGKVKFPEFLKEHLGEWPGLIVVDDAYDASVQEQEQQQQQQRVPLVQEQAHTNAQQQPQPQPQPHPPSPPSPVRQRGGKRQLESPGSGSGGAANVVAIYDQSLVLGLHQGFWFYTVGQRGGIKLPGGPWYVTRKDPDLNIVYVSRRYVGSPTGAAGAAAPGTLPAHPHTAFAAAPFSWLSEARPVQGPGAPPLFCKVRHGPHAYQCSLLPMSAHTPPTPQPFIPAAAEPPAAALSVPAVGTIENPTQAASVPGSTPDSVHTAVLAPAQQQQQQLQQVLKKEEAGWYDGRPLVVVLWGRDQGLAAGQYAVLYQGGQCLGAAQIERSIAAGELSDCEAAAQVGRLGLLWPDMLISGKEEGSGAVVLTADL